MILFVAICGCSKVAEPPHEFQDRSVSKVIVGKLWRDVTIELTLESESPRLMFQIRDDNKVILTDGFLEPDDETFKTTVSIPEPRKRPRSVWLYVFDRDKELLKKRLE